MAMEPWGPGMVCVLQNEQTLIGFVRWVSQGQAGVEFCLPLPDGTIRRVVDQVPIDDLCAPTQCTIDANRPPKV